MKQLLKNIKLITRLACLIQLRYFLLVCLVSVSCFAFSQKQNLKFDHLTTLDGLSQSNVLCIFQDSRGFMWFGTQDGLNKYDGYKFTVYKNDPYNKNSLSHNFITDIIEDKEGNLWIATWGGGINKFNRQQEYFTAYKHSNAVNSLSSDLVNSIIMDHKGDFWIGTQEGGLNHFDVKKQRFTQYVYNKNDPKSISDNDVVDLLEDEHHNLWIATQGGGLNIFDSKNKNFTCFLHNKNTNSLSANNVFVIYKNSKQEIWIGTEKGIDHFDKSTGNFDRIKKIAADNIGINDIVDCITEDNTGNLWIGTQTSGLYILNRHTGTLSSHRQANTESTSISDNGIYSVYKDDKGNMWVGTYSKGIDFANSDAGKFVHYKHSGLPNSLSNNKVLCFYEDSKNNLWIGTDGGGLNLFDSKNGTFTHFKHKGPNSICGDNVVSVVEDSEQNIWIGTWGAGITVWNRKKNTYKHFKKNSSNPSGLISNNIWFIFEDKDKNIWIGAYGEGLDLYDRNTESFIHYTHDKNNPHSISSNNVISFFEDSKGQLWIGTDGGGLNLFNKNTKTFSSIKHQEGKNSLSNNCINAIYEDKQGNFWITTDAGLNYWDRKKNLFSVYLTTHDLPHNTTIGILDDLQGNLWISTFNGLSKFNPGTRKFKNYNVTDGLQAQEFRYSFLKTRSGAMYFGGSNGFNEFFPEHIKQNDFDPPLVITDFQIFNQQVAVAANSKDRSPLKQHINQTKEITLSYKQSVFSFEFASLNYTRSEKKQYSYKLEGFDENWNNIGSRHTATYTNLNPGKYIFKVRGLTNEGAWSSKIASIQLVITPPFWLTWWFRIAVIGALAGSVILFYKARMNAVKRQRKILEQKVKEQTIQLVLSNEEERNARLEADHANEELANKNIELEQFVYIASHDLREPLRTTSGFVELFQKQYKGKLDEKADTYLSYISQSADRMKMLIDDLLDYSRIGGKKELQQLDCTIILQEVLTDLGTAITEAGAEIKYDNLPAINGHRTSIKQLFQNLIANGIKFRQKDVSPKIQIRSEIKDNAWQFSFTDNGIGIEPLHREKVFVIFQRLHTRKEYEGSGIGLAHCKKIVEMHGGKIWIESQPGKGSAFCFTLPAGEQGKNRLIPYDTRTGLPVNG
jgi:ligand-binding sensor domain-containing protein/signal transduction histidine kinase